MQLEITSMIQIEVCNNGPSCTCNVARLGECWNEFNFFQAHEIDLWSKMRAAIEIMDIGILIKEPEEIKVGTGIKLLIEIK